jgi:hypothetical protein
VVVLGARRREELAHILGVVSLFMGLEDSRSRERLATEGTPERSLSGMNATVILHVMAEFERLAAELALEGAIARVGREVPDQRTHVGESLPAKLAQST